MFKVFTFITSRISKELFMYLLHVESKKNRRDSFVLNGDTNFIAAFLCD